MVNENGQDVAIRIKEVKKRYRLGQIGGGTLQADLQSWWAKKRGKEDPNTMVDQNKRSNNKNFWALNGISLEIKKGEAIGIIGGNGAGKSTLLKLLSQVTAPTEGEIELFGRVASMLEVGTGFNREMTGRENIYMNGAILGMTKSEIDAKIEEIIDFSEVREFIDTPVKRYSSGMYVKLAFSVAAHLDSEIMIMDEVLAVGDMAFQKKCLDKMRSAARNDGRTVLYVSHNMNTIRQLCDRCVVLNEGKIIFDGEVDEAIGIYLKNGGSVEFPAYYDFTQRERAIKDFGKNVFAASLSFDHVEEAKYYVGDLITGKVIYDSRIKRDDVHFVFRIRDKYNGIKIGGVVLPKISIREGKGQEYSFAIDTKGLVADDYCLSFEIVQAGTLDNYYPLDNPGVAMPIKIENTGSEMWSVTYWGNVDFGKI